MQPPVGPSRLHRIAWLVVCLAAINAMDHGRKAANQFQQQVRIRQSQAAAAITAAVMPATPAAAQPPGQPAVTHFFHPAPLTAAQQQHNQVVQQHREQHREQLVTELQQLGQQQQQEATRLLLEAQRLAVAEFWKLVADFVILNPCPSHGLGSLPHDHPFLCLDANTDLVQLAARVS